jgi:hypothetical protein
MYISGLCNHIYIYIYVYMTLWVRRSTARAAESASVLQRPQQQYADGECAELALRAHQAFYAVCAPFVTQRLRVRLMLGRIGRLCSERTACRGMHVGRIEGDGAAAGLL